MHIQFLRIKKLIGKNIIETAARHNHREIQVEFGTASDGHITPARIKLNLILRGASTAAAVAGEAQALMIAAEVKPLKRTAVRSLEIIFGLPPQSTINHERFFNDSIKWAEQYFEVPVISAIVHNDEAAPHCHVLLLPLVDGRMIGSDLMGGPAKLRAMHSHFHEQVGQRYGLTRQAAAKPLSSAIRQQAMHLAFSLLESNSGLDRLVLRALLRPHEQNPEPLLLALGLAMPKGKVKFKDTFIGIMTKPCKPDNHIGKESYSHIGLDDTAAEENPLTLSCVGKTNSTASRLLQNEKHKFHYSCGKLGTETSQAIVSPSSNFLNTFEDKNREDQVNVFIKPKSIEVAPLRSVQPASIEGDYTRERDDNEQALYWSEEIGDFIKPREKVSDKSVIAASVRLAIDQIKLR